MTTAPRSFQRALLALAVLGLTSASCRKQTAKPPNILIVVVDTLRADRLGVYGNIRGLTPFLDEFSQQGVVFLNTYAASSWTAPSVASLFTSRFPSQHHVVTFGSILADQERTLAERLRDAHYVSGGFSANVMLVARRGYAKGFDQWIVHDGRGAELRSQGLAWFDALQRSDSQPVFLYFQYIEPHWPYTANEPFRSRFGRAPDGTVVDPIAETIRLGTPEVRKHWTVEEFLPSARLYDAEVAEVDDEIRLLVGDLRRRRFLDNAIVVITSDHGEEFAEHGGSLHGSTLYEESLRVPLIVVGSGIAAGRQVATNVSLADVAPTLLDLLGLPVEERFEGHSLRPLVRPRKWFSPFTRAEGPPSTPDVFFELLQTRPKELDVRAHERGILRGSIKLLVAPDGTQESYDLRSDSHESHPNSPAVGQRADQLMTALEARTTELRNREAVPALQEEIDEATKEKLHALGYL